jgi:hypothetical protein
VGGTETLRERVQLDAGGDRPAGEPASRQQFCGVGFGWLLEVAHRQRHEHRARRWQCRVADRPRERRGHVLGAGRLERPLDGRPGQRCRIGVGQQRLHCQCRAYLLARGDDQRAVPTGGVDDRAHRVTEAYRGVQVDQGGLPGQLGVDVGHADHRALVQAENVVEVLGEVGQERYFG